ncbi:unnamed protein product [Echinostoma caproni]|uniref:Myb-like domain-containing protein n=1 Tax=Echinostoma caproni TaxID=27848 RepID=A0A3P8L9J2_9TREM|nr:unnamed protein product [Echinostoma caproni]
MKTERSSQSPVKPSTGTDGLDLLAPQLRLDADGNIVLDETSLVVSVPETARDDTNVRHVSEETGLLNVDYYSFRNPPPRRGQRWRPQETVRFYRALSMFGRDFYLMAAMFPNRSRAELKVQTCRKFKKESHSNPYLVNQALRNRRGYDLTALIPLSDTEDEVELKEPSTEQPKRKRGRKPRDPNGPKRKERSVESIETQVETVRTFRTSDSEL